MLLLTPIIEFDPSRTILGTVDTAYCGHLFSLLQPHTTKNIEKISRAYLSAFIEVVRGIQNEEG